MWGSLSILVQLELLGIWQANYCDLQGTPKMGAQVLQAKLLESRVRINHLPLLNFTVLLFKV
jgi:hypothetical protein